MKKTTLIVFAILATLGANAFCGFYVAKAGSNLYNNKSEVILVRDGDRTTITMSNDFQGNVKDFAMVVPVPNVISRRDIKVADRGIFEFLDAYSAPRLVEYFDHNPCAVPPPPVLEIVEDDLEVDEVDVSYFTKRDVRTGVKIEAKYDVEEYEILILSATKSEGLEEWLITNGYKIPTKAKKVLEPYIKNKLKFFVVKVNLNKYNPQAHGGYLRPLQVSVTSNKFMLPIRLGMANSKGAQDMIVYTFSKKGRVECTNYRTVDVPSNRNVPTFVKAKFGNFYKDLFETSYRRQGKDAVFLEYAWNVTPRFTGMKCDPCVGNPPYVNELSKAGVHWSGSGQNVFFTRMHVRYALDKFPEDLFFQETPNNQNFQARYIITHPAGGDLTCDEGQQYLAKLKTRRKKELSEMSALTQWDALKYPDYVSTGSAQERVEVKEVDEIETDPIKNDVFPIGNMNNDKPKGPMLFLVLFVTMFIAYMVNNLALQRRLQR